MKINVSGYEIPLDNTEVRLAKEKVSDFLLRIKKISDEYNNPSFYFTTLLVGHLLTAELLDELSSEELEKAMTAIILSYGRSRKEGET